MKEARMSTKLQTDHKKKTDSECALLTYINHSKQINISIGKYCAVNIVSITNQQKC